MHWGVPKIITMNNWNLNLHLCNLYFIKERHTKYFHPELGEKSIWVYYVNLFIRKFMPSHAPVSYEQLLCIILEQGHVTSISNANTIYETEIPSMMSPKVHGLTSMKSWWFKYYFHSGLLSVAVQEFVCKSLYLFIQPVSYITYFFNRFIWYQFSHQT